MSVASLVVVILVATAGCGRLGFPSGSPDTERDAGVDGGAGDAGGDAALARPESERAFVDTFVTDSDSFTPIPGASVNLPPTATSQDWLVIGSGRLRRTGGRAPPAQFNARLVVGGTERGLGGSTAMSGSSGPFQFFDVVAAGAAPIEVGIELRSGVADGTVEQVRLVAVPLGAPAACASAIPSLNLTPEGAVLSLDAPAGLSVVLAQITVEDTTGGDVSVKVTTPGGDWPEARVLWHGRMTLQGLMISRAMDMAATGTLTMITRVLAGDEARMGHARICAIPQAAFAGALHAEASTIVTSTASTTPVEVQTLNITAPMPGRYLVLQNTAAYTSSGAATTTEVTFEHESDVVFSVDYTLNHGSQSPTFGYADVLDLDAVTGFRTLIAETTGAEVLSFETTSIAVGL